MFTRARLCTVLSLLALVLIVSVMAVPGAAAAKVKKIDLNNAAQAELETLKGVGPALAAKIIAARPFKSVDDMKNVSGIGESTFADLKDLVTVHAAQATETGTTANSTTAKGTEKTEAEKLININTADKAALEALPGIGPALADKIIAARPFKSVADLKNVKGIGQAAFTKIESLVTVEKPKAKRTASTGTAAGTTSTSKTAATQAASTEPLDLNTADKTALEALPGIGPALADKIIAARPFKKVEDLINVKGIGQAKFDAIKDMVEIGQPETAVNPKLKPGQTININTATLEQLDSLLGIGPVKAKAIVAGRPYAKIEDIMKVKGIKEKTFAKIKDYIVVK